jgi:hypothetical protein
MVPDQELPRCLGDSGEGRANTLMVQCGECAPCRLFVLPRTRRMLGQCRANAYLTDRSFLMIGKSRTLPRGTQLALGPILWPNKYKCRLWAGTRL